MGASDERRRTRLTIFRNSVTASTAVLLAACGGGATNSAGSGAPPTGGSTPTPTPPATPAPTPAPSPSAADTPEYKASAAVVSAKAAYAYDRGITGKGVTIAIVDSGISPTSPEFAGRISSGSTGFEQRIARCGTCPPETVPAFPIADLDGHGSQVASVAAAARDGKGMEGMAPDATILALKVSGPDFEGVTAGSTTPIRESGQPNAALIAPALREAVAKGAFVTVMSLNGFAGSAIATEQRAAMDAVRAADRLLVQSVPNEAGRDGFAGQFAENLVGADRANADWSGHRARAARMRGSGPVRRHAAVDTDRSHMRTGGADEGRADDVRPWRMLLLLAVGCSVPVAAGAPRASASGRTLPIEPMTFSEAERAGAVGTGCTWLGGRDGSRRLAMADDRAAVRRNGVVLRMKPAAGAKPLFLTYDRWTAGTLRIVVRDTGRVVRRGHEFSETVAWIDVVENGRTRPFIGRLNCGS